MKCKHNHCHYVHKEKKQPDNWKMYDYTGATTMREFFLQEYEKWRLEQNAGQSSSTCCTCGEQLQCCCCGQYRTRFVFGDATPVQAWNTYRQYIRPLK